MSADDGILTLANGELAFGSGSNVQDTGSPILRGGCRRLTPAGGDVNFGARASTSEDDSVTTTATKDQLLDRAMERTGLSDFGPDGWQEGFDALVSSIPGDIGDNEDQVQRVEKIVVDRLVNRLKIEEWYS